MNLQECCPRCRLIVPAERMVEIPPVCPHCGWILSKNEEDAGGYLNRRFRQAAVLFSVGLVAGFIHLVTWDSYFVSVIPLKTRQILRIASTSDLLRLAQICEDRKNPECSEDALTAAVKKNPDDVSLKENLGKIRYQMGDFKGAAEVYTEYFNQGGRQLEPAFLYAKSLQELDRKGEAAQYYEFILEKKPETLQITVTQKYVNLLKEIGQYQRAIELIESIRKKGSNAAYFLDAELQDLKKKARSRSRST